MIPPPVEFTVRLVAEIAPRTVAFAFRTETALPVAVMLPTKSLFVAVVRSIVLPVAVSEVLPETPTPPEV